MENEARIEQSVTIIKEWISQSPHMPAVDDEIIRIYLRGRKYSLEKAKKALEVYYTGHHVAPEFYMNLDPTTPAMKEYLQLVNFSYLPKRTPEGFVILVSRLCKPIVGEIDRNNYGKQYMMTFKILLQENDATEIVIIYDLFNFTATDFFKYFTIPFVKKFLQCIKNAVPYRVKQIHLANAPNYIDTALATIKPVLKDKLVQRIRVHKDNESLQKYLPKDVLPTEYGGDLESLQVMNDKWLKKLEEYKDSFLKEEKMLLDLPLPPKSVLEEHALFGAEGSFRKLNLD